MSERKIAEDIAFQADSRIIDYVEEDKENQIDEVSFCDDCGLNKYECECPLKDDERSYL